MIWKRKGYCTGALRVKAFFALFPVTVYGDPCNKEFIKETRWLRNVTVKQRYRKGIFGVQSI